MMNLELESMAIQMPVVDQHPNREAFRGVLTLVDVPSDKPPAGSRGHRVVLTRTAAEKALAFSARHGAGLLRPHLTGMTPAERSASLLARRLSARRWSLGGHLFARDFPEIVKEIGKSRRLAEQAPPPPGHWECPTKSPMLVWPTFAAASGH